jgi:hypothetical protein
MKVNEQMNDKKHLHMDVSFQLIAAALVTYFSPPAAADCDCEPKSRLTQ